MAAKKPLVITNGRIEQLQSGDTLDAAVSEVDVVSKTNANAGSIVIGQVVYIKTNGQVDLARANASGTMQVLGLVKDASIASAAAGIIQTDGVLAATTGQWDTVTGGSGGLTVGSTYYVSAATAGALTTTAPTAAGEFVQQVGIAISSTELEITILTQVKL